MSGTKRSAGTTLIELLMGLVIASVIAAALLRMVMVDLRFAENREAWRTARQAARSGLVVLSADLRMVETGDGVEAAGASGQDVSVRAPYAFGTLCSTTGSTSVVALIPVDSAMFSQPGHSGFAWRDPGTGAYTYAAGGGLSGSADTSACADAGITMLPGGRIVAVTGAIPAETPAGTIVFLYRRIRYEVRSSVLMPGQIALWRTLLTAETSQEIGAPFVPAARFRFYDGASPTPLASPPAPLSRITGLELAFGGRSDITPRGASGPKIVPFTTAIFFRNRP